MVPFTEQNTDNFVRNCKWIKVSINAGNAEQYAAVHRTKATDFQRVLENMKRCVAVKKEKGYSCTLGTQLLLIPENASSVTELARTVRDIGMDYLVIKPYSQHMYSQTHRYESVDYSRYFDLEKELRSLETDDFHIVFRMHTMEKLRSDEARYCRCLAVPYFWAYIDSGGDVYGCSAYLGAEDFNYGNIHDLRFPEIWEGEKRRKGLEYVRTKLDIRECRLNCRMDEVNRYLWDLKNPPAHANFI
jgi:radical SAM protein with 4Fe4S-binding SPASM domain